jgi:hypothetical protein
MHWLGLALGALFFELVELGLLLVDAIAALLRPRPSPIGASVARTPADARSDSSPAAGQIGTVIRWKSPRGIVEIDGQPHPALAFRGKPHPGDAVRVIRVGRHSLLVEPIG